MKRYALTGLILSATLPCLADGPEDNNPLRVRQVPPPGVEVPAALRAELEAGLAELQGAITSLETQWAADPARLALLPDVEIFHKAVDYALRFGEFQKENEFKVARELLARGRERAGRLAEGEAPWLRSHGLVVRGFRSRLDGSVQPYGLVIPPTYAFDGAQKHRLDLWFHGRGERTLELGFLQQRLTSAGQYTPPDTIVLHPFARYSNGNKLAGEIDCLEALEHVRAGYRIDPDRIVVRGFSMGGAACWNFAVHYADRWCAANPGAGYAETPEFLRTFQGETLDPTWYQRKLWHLYDCTDYALNLYHLPTVAYSGELDRQKQAADIMAEAMAKQGLTLCHVIGPQTGHQIHPDAKVEIEERLASVAAVGRDRLPRTVRFVTWTLRYNRMHWVTIDALDAHWERARIEARIVDDGRLEVGPLENIRSFTLEMAAGTCPFDPSRRPTLVVDGRTLEGPAVLSDRSWRARVVREDGVWRIAAGAPEAQHALVKRHGSQGPVDDAFLDSFLMVSPGGEPWNEAAGRWSAAELEHARRQWRQQFRGEARVKRDRDLTPEDIAGHNLVLWGDPGSNEVMAKIMPDLPIKWTREGIQVGERSFPAEHHAVILIYPNPLNPDRYVVLNSGFTYREYDYLNNARQVPKLPDWAVVDLRSPPTTQLPGAIPAAGFFDEGWGLKPAVP